MDARKKCRHCGFRNVNRSRGLCFTCFYSPGVVDLYPVSQLAHHGNSVADFNGGYASPVIATTAAPGSAGKVAVLEQRAEAGTSLWHPKDEPMDREAR